MANVSNRGKYEVIFRNWGGGAPTVKAILLTTSFSFSADDNTLNQISTNRVSGTTDQTLGSLAITEDDTGDQAYLDAADPTWTSVAGGATATGCYTYIADGGAESGDDLLGFVNTADTATNGGNITIQFASNGFLALT